MLYPKTTSLKQGLGFWGLGFLVPKPQTPKPRLPKATPLGSKLAADHLLATLGFYQEGLGVAG